MCYSIYMKSIYVHLASSPKTHLMGILNVTPDSFSDGGKYYPNIEAALRHAYDMVKNGATILDIGGESTRPGAEPISIEEEIYRVVPIVADLHEQFGKDILISVDTYKSQVADEALSAGADIINSLGGFLFDPQLAGVCAEYDCPVILYHIKGKPMSMQTDENLAYDALDHVEQFFRKQMMVGLENGMSHKQFILDPGIGFGKTLEQNLEIIQKLETFKKFGAPICIGVSRKSHLGKLLQEDLGFDHPPDVQNRLEGALAETAVAVLHGAKIVRTHDVAETKKFLAVLDRLKS
jgi:dihydropteroate synthase